MQELLDWLEYIEDDRQQRKIRHTLKDILVIVLFATLANADDWVEMALFAENYQDYLKAERAFYANITEEDITRLNAQPDYADDKTAEYLMEHKVSRMK